MRLSKYLIALTIFVAGCETPKPIIEYRTQEVKVPVPVVCQTEEPKAPETAFEKLTEQDSLYEKVKALLSDRLLYLAYQAELRTALKSCK